MTRAGATYCALRLRAHDDDQSVVGGADLVPGLITLLGATLDDDDIDDVKEDEPHERAVRRGPARRARRAAPPSRRSRALVITAVVLVLAFFGLTTFANFYTERLWYRDIGYGSVFSTPAVDPDRPVRASSALLMALVVAVNMVIAFRLRPLFHPPSPEQTGLDRYRQAVTPIRTWLVVGVARAARHLRRHLRRGGVAQLPALAQRRAVRARGRLLRARTSASSSSTCRG